MLLRAAAHFWMRILVCAGCFPSGAPERPVLLRMLMASAEGMGMKSRWPTMGSALKAFLKISNVASNPLEAKAENWVGFIFLASICHP